MRNSAYFFILCMVLIAILFTACICLTSYFIRRERRLIRRIQNMLDQAIGGSFKDEHLDESGISAVESDMHRYLSDSRMSYEKLAADKEHIQMLVSDIAHQSVTPLSNIMLYTQLLEEWLLPDEQQEPQSTDPREDSRERKEVLTAIGQQAEKLEFLIETLVKLSRMEAGIISVHTKKMPVQPVLSALEQQFSPKAQKKHIRLAIEPSEETAVFDKKWTVEAAANIVDNAIKYTPQGGTVSIRVRPYSFFTCISVSDNGPGISEEEQANIFTRFYRCAEHADEPGLGIGLYLAREVMKAQEGYIKLRSKPGNGSTFSLFLKIN